MDAAGAGATESEGAGMAPIVASMLARFAQARRLRCAAATALGVRWRGVQGVSSCSTASSASPYRGALTQGRHMASKKLPIQP